MLSSLFFCPLMPVSRDALSLSVPSAGAYEASFTGRVESERSLEVSVTLTCLHNEASFRGRAEPIALKGTSSTHPPAHLSISCFI